VYRSNNNILTWLGGDGILIIFNKLIIMATIKTIIIKNEGEIIMAAEVESMFYVREKPWHGLGVRVMEAPTSKNALVLAGLDWKVIQEPIFTENNELISGYKANIRDTDRKPLGVVSNKYKVIQNDEAFAFTDALLGEGVRYETAGSLKDGKTVWMLARLPQEYIISGERICPYLVFSNTHDGSGAVKVAMTPVRVVCSNTLNLCLSTAKRSWSMIHTGDISQKLDEARNTLLLAENYMTELGKEFENLRNQKISDKEVEEYIQMLLPMKEDATSLQEKNIIKLRDDLRMRYYDAPDLKHLGKTAYRFINAVSDFATHSSPLRRNTNFQENVFAKTMNGNPLIDRAYKMLCTA
jgi:phage/plasmid-like protein (TIGR03299 family)